MALAELRELLAPPETPTHRPTESDWAKVERTLGTVLPDDFVEFLEIYGAGRIDDFLGIFSPASPNQNINLLDVREVLLDSVEGLDLEDAPPYPIYPPGPGLVPWGRTDNGNFCFWIADGEPTEWRVAISRARGFDLDETRLSFSQFLVEFLSGRFSPKYFPDTLPDSHDYAARQ